MSAIRKFSTDTPPIDRQFDRQSNTSSVAPIKSDNAGIKNFKEKERQKPGNAQENNKIRAAIEAHIPTDGAQALPIKRNHLINKLNFINFQDKTIAVHFNQGTNQSTFEVAAMPDPCIKNRVFCRWCNPDETCQITEPHAFSHIEIRTRNTHLTARPDFVSFSSSGIELDLNEECLQWPINGRSVQIRKSLTVRLTQNGCIFEGTLSEFSPGKLIIRLTFKPPQTPLWINESFNVNLMVFDRSCCLYTGECAVVELSPHVTGADLSLVPCWQKMPRFKPVKYRSIRQALSPAPNIGFIHPLTGNAVALKTIDLSGSGVCVEDDPDCPVLLPGMLIPELSIEFCHDSCITCQAQVVYSDKILSKQGERIRAGIALLDINFADFIRLSSLLHQAEDENSFVCRPIDTDALWEFFFETGFIYPGKYGYFQKNKKEIKEVYKKLYTKSPLIAGYFTYQDKGRILGHMSMLRLYDRAWMIHHHAARKTSMVKAGIAVLKQIGRFGYEGHRFPSIHMDYLLCYYRPDNLFPAFVFGGAVNAINHPQQCSEDAFAYFHINSNALKIKQPGKPWAIDDATANDLSVLQEHYRQVSGGLMIDALDLHPSFKAGTGLEQEYEKYGFSKQKTILALKKSGHLKAVIIVNKTDTGLNMSDLTNSIKIVVIDGNGLDKDILMSVAESIAAEFPTREVPVLLHPVSHAESVGLKIEKKYNLWIMKIEYSDKYFAHINTLFKEHLKQEKKRLED